MKAKAKPIAKKIEELPDAWERFETAFDTVMKAKPMPRLQAKKDTKAGDPSARKPRRGRPPKPSDE
jgi:hypothetical protein